MKISMYTIILTIVIPLITQCISRSQKIASHAVTFLISQTAAIMSI